jgi:hypothetical protein
VKVYASIDGAKPFRIHGPADLKRVGKDDAVWIAGDPTPEDHGTWAAALGGAALRGALVDRARAVTP